MTTKKTVVVFGATGRQGGSVIDSILSDPTTAATYQIRGLTRDPTKPAAQALAKRGVECVAANLDDKASIEAAFKGAYAVFAVTNYWEKMSSKIELAQGHAIADTAKAAGVQHLIWSSLLDINVLTKGEFPNVYHFDAKAEIETYIRKLGIPATFFMPGFYMSNLPESGILRPAADDPNKLTFAYPGAQTTPFPLFAADRDTGKFVKGILTHRDKLLGERVYAATDYYTVDQIIATFKQVFPKSGEGLEYVHVPKEDFKAGVISALGAPDYVAEEMWENFAFMDKWGYYGKASLEGSLALLDTKPTSLLEFLQTEKSFKQYS